MLWIRSCLFSAEVLISLKASTYGGLGPVTLSRLPYDGTRDVQTCGALYNLCSLQPYARGPGCPTQSGRDKVNPQFPPRPVNSCGLFPTMLCALPSMWINMGLSAGKPVASELLLLGPGRGGEPYAPLRLFPSAFGQGHASSELHFR